MKAALRVLVISRDDVMDRRTWSGISGKIYESLSATCAGVIRMDKLGYPKGIRIAFENWLLSLVRVSSYCRPRTARYHAIQIDDMLRQLQVEWDCAIVIDSYMLLPYLASDKPLIYVSDCTKVQLVRMNYPGFQRLSAATVRRLMAMEKLAYQKASLCAFSSQWAADSAIADYGVSPDKVAVIPFGANVDHVPDKEAACEDGPWKHTKECELLMIGVDWVRKGGDIARGILDALSRRGLKARLTVCGTVPPGTPCSSMRVFPFLDKNRPDDLGILEGLISEASYLIVPSRAECYGIVFCEAFAYGVPCVTCNVGGIAEVVTNEVNGFVLERDALPDEYARLIIDNYTDRDTYIRFRRAARNAYEATYNWAQWTEGLLQRAGRLCRSTKGRVDFRGT